MNEFQRNQLDIEYDNRQLKLMIQKISAFEQGDLYLIYLIDDLDGLVKALTSHDQEWKKNFTSYWWDLEQVYAVAASEDRSYLDPDDKKIIEGAILELKKLINLKLTEYDED